MISIQSSAGRRLGRLILVSLLAVGVLPGCGRKNDSTGNPAPPAEGQPAAASTSAPVTQPALSAWQQGDKARAVGRFLEADWSARPLFAPGSLLSLSEDQFRSFPAADRKEKSKEMMSQLETVKQLAQAVAQAGRDAAAKKDLALAQKHFAALQQFGEALDNPDSLRVVQIVGQILKKKADTESAKLEP